MHAAGLGTTVLAAVGVLLAGASLGWQAYTFFHSGSRVSAELRVGATNGNAFATAVGQPTVQQIESLASQGLNQPVLAVEVRNAGRGSTSIVSVDLLFDDGITVTGQYLRGSPELPFRMDGESEKTWLFDVTQANAVARASQHATDNRGSITIRGQVKIGGRTKPVVSKNKIRVL